MSWAALGASQGRLGRVRRVQDGSKMGPRWVQDELQDALQQPLVFKTIEKTIVFIRFGARLENLS